VKYGFHAEALAEYREAVRYYAHRDRAVALRLIEEVERVIGEISEAPERWSIVDEDVRRCLTRRFPYAVLYTIEADFILIVAVAHGRREPGYWRTRVRDR
jgi:toxin ParE1/3/4